VDRPVSDPPQKKQKQTLNLVTIPVSVLRMGRHFYFTQTHDMPLTVLLSPLPQSFR